MFTRSLSISKNRSFFLFGARSTGKSTLIEQLLAKENVLWIDLLDPKTEHAFLQDLAYLSRILDAECKKNNKAEWVVLDEVQKIPEQLGLVHQSIRKQKFKFCLTGSSARKLKRSGADMLAGRANFYELFPLTSLELGSAFNLDEVLTWGSLPELVSLNTDDKKNFLNSYCTTYLKEEIIAEQLVRKVRPFRRFLELAALQSGQIVNHSSFARDVGADDTTVRTYFEILEDTLIGFPVGPFLESVRKRQRTNPKFYLFDTGVTRHLAGVIDESLSPRTSAYGRMFEQWFITEVYRMLKYQQKQFRLSYLTTKDGAEIDLIIEFSPKNRFAIEIKSATTVDILAVRKFAALVKDIPFATPFFISQDPYAQEVEGIRCVHYGDFLSSFMS